MGKFERMVEKRAESSRKAVEQFLSTEETLKSENEQLAQTLAEVDEEAKRLQEIREQGESLLAENEGIIRRIGEIVRGGDD